MGRMSVGREEGRKFQSQLGQCHGEMQCAWVGYCEELVEAQRSLRHRVDGVVYWREDQKGITGKADEGNVMEGRPRTRS